MDVNLSQLNEIQREGKTGNMTNVDMNLNSSLEYFDYPDLELPIDAQVVLILVYGITALTSLIGNITVVIVMSCGRQSTTDLSVFLINLAVADIFRAAFCLPFSFTKAMLGYWVFGDVMCPVAAFILVSCVSVSIFTNVTLGIDRFWAVQFPLKQRLTRDKAIVISVGIWFASMLAGSFQLVYTKTRDMYYDGRLIQICDETWPNPMHRSVYSVLLLLCMYVVPGLLLTCTYSQIVVTLWKRIPPGQSNRSRESNQLSSKRKVTKMLIVVMASFFLCWLPLHIFTLTFDLHPNLFAKISTKEDEQRFIGVFYACHWLAMSTSLINPIIYGFLNDGFRADLRRLCALSPALIVQKCQKLRLPQRHRTLSARSSSPTHVFFMWSFRRKAAERQNQRDAANNRVVGDFKELPNTDVF